MRKILITFSIILFSLLISSDLLEEKENNVFIEKIDLNLKDDELAITFFKFENGNATLIQTMNNKLLINSGGKEDLEKLKEVIKLYNLSELDYFLVTNDIDKYSGNTEYILENIKIKSSIAPRKYNVNSIESKNNIVAFKNLNINIIHDTINNLEITYLEHTMLFLFNLDENNINDIDISKYKFVIIDEINSKNLTFKNIGEKIKYVFYYEDTVIEADQLELFYKEWIDTYKINKFEYPTLKLISNEYDIITIPHIK